MSHHNSVRIAAIVAGATVLLHAFAGLSQVRSPEGTVSSLQVEQEAYGADESLNIRFTLVNTTAAPLSVLKWRTPLEGFNADMFTVRKAGEPVPYIGRIVKRAAPQPEDYVTLAAGESVSAVVDLGEAYAIFEADEYSVQLTSSVLDIGGEEPATLAAKLVFMATDIVSNVVTFRLLEDREPPPLKRALLVEPAPTEAVPKTPVFKNCSSSEKGDLNDALTEGGRIAAGAVLALAGTSESARPNADRYTTWFGVHTAARYSSVLGNFEQIHDALANETITFNCDCDESWYAYVFPTSPYEIWLCNAFWSAPLVGTDSKAGTLVHEVSHFNVVAGTDDVVYGQASCKILANNDPGQAIENADSHEYFAENTPTLTMGRDFVIYGLLAVFVLIVTERLLRHFRQRRSVRS